MKFSIAKHTSREMLSSTVKSMLYIVTRQLSYRRGDLNLL